MKQNYAKQALLAWAFCATMPTLTTTLKATPRMERWHSVFGLLAQDEIHNFADLQEPVTDRLMQEISVQAFVYDGTRRNALRRGINIIRMPQSDGSMKSKKIIFK